MKAALSVFASFALAVAFAVDMDHKGLVIATVETAGLVRLAVPASGHAKVAW